MKFRILSLLVLGLALALMGAACGGSDDGSAGATDTGAPTAGTTTAADECAKENLQLVNPGQLTIATSNPSFPPWFIGPGGGPWNPTKEPTKEGYEAEVAYAVAEELGFADAEVNWVAVPFETLFRPGAKDFDFTLQQTSVSEERDQVVDFSDSYYDVEQAVVTLKGSEFAKASSLADLEGAKLGAPVGTTSYNAIVETIQPSQEPQAFNSVDNAISALKNRQIDGIVVDFPSTGFITGVQAPNATAVGRLPAEGQEHFGALFGEGNPLRDCVNEAIAAIRESGRLDEFAQEWIESSAPPVLE
jgi:polar amino acid transport system substrate-binding protein